jgi:hypothetical protein
MWEAYQDARMLLTAVSKAVERSSALRGDGSSRNWGAATSTARTAGDENRGRPPEDWRPWGGREVRMKGSHRPECSGTAPVSTRRSLRQFPLRPYTAVNGRSLDVARDSLSPGISVAIVFLHAAPRPRRCGTAIAGRRERRS